MIDGTGYVESFQNRFDFSELEYPDKEMVDDLDKALDLDEFKSLKNLVKVFRVNFKPVRFMGQALIYNRTDKPDCTYALCISGCVTEIRWIPEYIDWLYRHELRHCIPNKNIYMVDSNGGNEKKVPFRFHDISLKDLGNGNTIGFFWEDFVDIACCDMLMAAFRNVEGIEEYL